MGISSSYEIPFQEKLPRVHELSDRSQITNGISLAFGPQTPSLRRFESDSKVNFVEKSVLIILLHLQCFDFF